MVSAGKATAGPALLKTIPVSRFFPWHFLGHFLAFLSGLGQPDRYCLFPAFDFIAFASPPAFCGAPLVATHLILDITAGTAGIFAFSLLSHFLLLGFK
jgi:hypothetical protein